MFTYTGCPSHAVGRVAGPRLTSPLRLIVVGMLGQPAGAFQPPYGVRNGARVNPGTIDNLTQRFAEGQSPVSCG